MLQEIKMINRMGNKKTVLFFLASLTVGVLWFLVEISFVYILQGFLQSIGVGNEGQALALSWYPREIEYTTGFLIAFGFCRALVFFMKYSLAMHLQQSFLKDVRSQFIRAGFDPVYYRNTSEFLTLFTEKTNQSATFIQFTSLFIICCVSCLWFLLFGFWFSFYEMLFSLIFLIVLIWPVKMLTQSAFSYGEKINRNWENINGEVLSSFKNIFFLKVYDLLPRQRTELDFKLKLQQSEYNRYANKFSLAAALPMFVGILILSICTYCSVVYFKTEGVKLLAFFYIFMRLTVGVSELSQHFSMIKISQPAFNDVMNSLERLLSGHSLKSHETIPSGGKVNLNTEGGIAIAFKNTDFGYGSTKSLLRNINLNLKPSEALVIKGRSGSGKSTLLKLLLGIERPTAGQVLINGTKVDELAPSWRDSMSYVGPEPYLIAGTLRENLSFGLPPNFRVTDVDLVESLHATNMWSELEANGYNLDTVLNESLNLSTGQKQRLSIARSLVRKPKLLILDEATANLDQSNELNIISKVRSQLKLSTFVIVTHKESYNDVADILLDLDQI